MQYDAAAMAAQRLDPNTTQLYYYDETLQQYINVASQVDTTKGIITAQIEHFTVYLPVAKQMSLVGNNPPIVAMQLTTPNPIRANAPIYVRVTAKDLDQGNSIAGVTLFYRKLPALPALPGSWQQAYMHPEINSGNIQDTYAYVIPASYLTSADRVVGNDIEYYATATDNLGLPASTASTFKDVTRIYNAGSMVVSTVTLPLNISAGFQRLFLTRLWTIRQTRLP